MIWGNSWLIITLIAVLIDFTIGEFPGKHPVQILGDIVNYFEKKAYKDSVFRGASLAIIVIFSAAFIGTFLQVGLVYITTIYKIPEIIGIVVLGLISSTGLASKCLKDYVRNVLKADQEHKREKLSLLVTRNTNKLSDKKVYSSLIESHAENLSDGLIAPLFYLILFGLPGIMVFKAVSTLDSMVGYKNSKYVNYGKVSAIIDDILNLIPSRITALLIWLLSKDKVSLKVIKQDARKYSSSPNAGYPVAAAAYNLGVVLGGPVYYGDILIDKSEVGIEKTENYENAAYHFLRIHSIIEIFILLWLILSLVITMYSIGYNGIY